MKLGLIISDTGPIFSLALINQLGILPKLFNEIYIPNAVWEELTRNPHSQYYPRVFSFFQDKMKAINGFNELTFVMDYGESEAVILCKELKADYLLIDDKKARKLAENFGIKCIGTIGILSIAKEKDFIQELRPSFDLFLKHKRFYSKKLLNAVLSEYQEAPLF